MKIECSECHSQFELDSDQLDFYTKSQGGGLTFIMIECHSCKKFFSLNPQVEQQPDLGAADFAIRTPIAGCCGHTTYVNDGDEAFYGCGETGAVWRTKEALNRSVEQIVKRYPHRTEFYVRLGDSWISSDIEEERASTLIGQETRDDLSSYLQS